MTIVYGASDDLVEIENTSYIDDEIGCYDRDVRIWFDDGTVIRCGYSKPDIAVWYIVVEHTGTAKQYLTVCNDEMADIYSDIFEIDAEPVRHAIVKHDPPMEEISC